ncbi:MAG: metallophosphoesterase family protein [bacterium]|nr:metallophosphoesterase family protein [bacterium]
MSDTNKIILNLINENKSMKEICSILNISEKQLYVRIKQIINQGYQIKTNCIYDFDINYTLLKTRKAEDYNIMNIGLEKDVDIFKCLAVSDIHVGNIDSNINYLNTVYDFANREGIHYILNCGDIIEGDYTTSKKSIPSTMEQLEYLLKKHPYDKNILNLLVLGNHEFYSLKKDGLDIAKKISNSRYDIIPINYGQGNIRLKKDSIALFHKLTDSSKPNLDLNQRIILSGHGHMMKTKVKDEVTIACPTLSKVSTDSSTDVIPSFIYLIIYFEKDKIEYVEAKQFAILDKTYKVSESKCKVKLLNKK